MKNLQHCKIFQILILKLITFINLKCTVDEKCIEWYENHWRKVFVTVNIRKSWKHRGKYKISFAFIWNICIEQ